MKHFTVRQFMRKAVYLPETCMCSDAFETLTREKAQCAIVVDEYGGTAGLVSMEDMLEEIVGNIQDEYDEEEELISRMDDGSYMIDGQTTLEELEELFNIHFECEDIDTINGYMIYKLGKIPEEQEQFQMECGGYLFDVAEVADKMIRKVRVTKIQEKEQTTENE